MPLCHVSDTRVSSCGLPVKCVEISAKKQVCAHKKVEDCILICKATN